MSFPQLTTEIIRQQTTDKSWQRGQDYYNNDCIRQICQRGNLITADLAAMIYQ